MLKQSIRNDILIYHLELIVTIRLVRDECKSPKKKNKTKKKIITTKIENLHDWFLFCNIGNEWVEKWEVMFDQL